MIVFYRTPDRLDSCIEALQRQTLRPDEILVIDNSSALDGLWEQPSAKPGYRWVRAPENLGYGAACNLGARLARGESLLFLNADLTLEPDACQRLDDAIDGRPEVAVAGPRIHDADGKIELSARSFPNVTTGVLGRSSLATRWLAALGRTPAAVGDALATSGLVDWVSGACMLVRRSSFDRVGGFDEAYWMYWEDADLCRRLRRSGQRTMICVEARAHHATGSSGTSARTIEAFHRSAARYFTVHLARSATAAKVGRLALGMRMWLMLLLHRVRAGA